jgi:hypothetical protein
MSTSLWLAPGLILIKVEGWERKKKRTIKKQKRRAGREEEKENIDDERAKREDPESTWTGNGDAKSKKKT